MVYNSQASVDEEEEAMYRALCPCAVTAFVFTGLAHAQGVGTIVGTVTDPSGAVISSATVLVKQSGTGRERSTATNTQGYFVVPSAVIAADVHRAAPKELTPNSAAATG
jgi:hypothetical protein